MEITDVKIRQIYSGRNLKAIVSITMDNLFAVHDIKIIEANDHVFVAMPSRVDRNGKMRDIAHPINQEMRNMIERSILREYEKSISTGGDAPCLD